MKKYSLDKKQLVIHKTQKALEIFAFFSVFPLIKVGGISITFPIFLGIIYIYLKYGIKPIRITHWIDILVLTFLVLVFLSWVFQEDTTFRSRSLLSNVKLIIQYIYWTIIALFIKTWIYEYDFYKISKSIFLGIVFSTFYYLILNRIHPVFAPNEFAYVIVLALPIGYYYVMKRFSFGFVIAISLFMVVAVMYSGSRTGSFLTIFELLLIFMFGKTSVKKILLFIVVLAVPLVPLVWSTLEYDDLESLKYELADYVEDISPKLAYTLRMEENIFERDKSWLIRELMWQKGQIIFDEHPFLGIGPGNFTKYYVEINPALISEWLNARTIEGYNKVSAQNSYLMILSENGIFALITIVVIFILIIIRGFYYLRVYQDSIEIYIYIPFLATLFYGFILVTTMGTLFWFVFGMALTLTQRKRRLS